MGSSLLPVPVTPLARSPITLPSPLLYTPAATYPLALLPWLAFCWKSFLHTQRTFPLGFPSCVFGDCNTQPSFPRGSTSSFLQVFAQMSPLQWCLPEQSFKALLSPHPHLDSILKSRDITSLMSVRIVKAMVFFSSHVQMWELDHKEGWVLKNWFFQTGDTEDSWEFFGHQANQTSQYYRESTLNMH